MSVCHSIIQKLRNRYKNKKRLQLDFSQNSLTYLELTALHLFQYIYPFQGCPAIDVTIRQNIKCFGSFECFGPLQLHEAPFQYK